MRTFSDRFEEQLVKMLLEEIERSSVALANGSAADFAEYKFQAGRVNGLRLCIDYCEEARSIISRG
jgi:hypothetical protein